MVTKDSMRMERLMVDLEQVRAVLIRHNYFKSQLRQVVTTLELNHRKDLSRCIQCNTVLISVPKSEIEDKCLSMFLDTRGIYGMSQFS